ncbi:hypothetical protein C1752_02244 [Acaryochloris thomasi RCC1774]|uniref:Glycosyltransferase RgtA/B/C/D-like domain-containing protein n=1 Tax=Acaryochloris thomasi RCC1774 TaxID=1764569 RepID=A0A2W1JP02_9CYAN|nr:hypothetical protein [Acaryochloris thomasi]PZD73165.1 hypothetical protein C1752_02244 [Acaryochloris thomasi RCC1774]
MTSWQHFLDRSQRLFTPNNRTFWFRLSFIAPLYFGLIALGYQMLGPEYVVQDDARQHVVWMQRFVDPQVFAGDAIANYYLAIAPPGYKGFYWILAQLGIEPLLTAKFLPLILALITTYFAYKLALKILPVHLCGFLTTLILNQQIWLDDELISATPRAFYYPLFTTFLYCVTQRALIPCLAIIALQGLFYAPVMLLSVAILSLRLLTWRQRWPRLTQDRSRYLFWFAGCSVAALVILFLLRSQGVGPTVTALQMRDLPEFGLHGRHEYFDVNPLYFLFQGRSGLNISWFPASILMGLALPFLAIGRFTQKMTPNVAVIYQSFAAALGLYILAHLLLFKLYYPSRYTYHSLRVILALAAGIALTILLEAGWSWMQHKRQTQAPFHRREQLLITFIGLLIAIELLVPALPPVFLAMEVWIEGQAPELYTFLAQQPRDTVVATLAPESDNLGAFAQRSTLMGHEFALALHPQFHRVVQQRIAALLDAQYSSDPAVVQQIIDQYSIDFFLVEHSAFTPEYLLSQDWLVNRSDTASVTKAIQQMRTKPTSLLFPKALTPCGIRSTQDWTLLETQCLSRFLATSPITDRSGRETDDPRAS